jgi:hypothetical protein
VKWESREKVTLAYVRWPMRQKRAGNAIAYRCAHMA